MKITLKISEDGREFLTRVFDDGVYRIGRSDLSDIVLDSDSISRAHVEIRVTESSVYVTNMSSPGRLKVNGRAKETEELADGDELTLGPYRVMLYHGDHGDFKPTDSPMEAPVDISPAPEPQAPPDGGFGGGFDGNAALAYDPDAAPQPQFAEPDPQASPLDALGAPQAEAQMVPVEGGSFAPSETEVEAKNLVAKLFFMEGARAGEEIPIDTYEVSLGRSKKADVFIDDEKLSRIHAKISRVGLGYRLIDLNSRNGTYVNGMRVLEHPLNSFDQIELGNTKIRFLIQDLMSMNLAGGPLAPAGPTEATQRFEQQTRSIQMNALPPETLAQLGASSAPQQTYPTDFVPDTAVDPAFQKNTRLKVYGIFVVLGLAAAVYLMLPFGEKPKEQIVPKEKIVDTKLPPLMPKEYADLSPDMARMIEGNYNAAIKAGEAEQYDGALAYLKKIHDVLPYYKQSLDLREQFQKKLREKQMAESQEKLKKDDKADLQIYLEEGQQYLRDGEFEKAAEAFNSAIVIEPKNELAIKGLKAAEAKVRSIELIPPDRDPEAEKRKLVGELFQQAVAAFTLKNYQQAVDIAENIRRIELQGDKEYLNQAKQIIDRAKLLQKEEFEPFLIQAKEKYAEGDYNASRDLCEEMLKRDGTYDEAKECVLKAKKQLNKLAKEAYTHGYILESMNRLEEAKSYWNRAKNYVRPGDDYFDKVNKKLEYYQ